MNNVYAEIIRLAEGMENALTERRRDFHKYAETGWFEMRTSSLIARRLTELGYEVLTGEDVCKKEARMGVPSQEELDASYERAVAQGADPEFVERTKDGMTGVIGILRAGEGPVVGMRFDIDALGVVERTDDGHFPAREGFGSVNPGMMHACGHDGHATIGLGVAEVLMQIKDQLHGTVKLIFQPAEEGVRGAKSIAENGHLDDVDYLMGAHIAGYEDGDIHDVLPGRDGGVATTKYDVVFRGLSAHAGRNPEQGKNALLAAATAVVNLNAIPRNGFGSSRINVGTFHGGTGRNVIADTAKLEIEVRGETIEINDYMCDYALKVIEGAALMHGVEYEVKVMGGAIPIVSSRPLMARVSRVCEEVGLDPYAVPKVSGNGGAEDVCFMMHRVQEHGGEATYMGIYTTIDAPPHNSGFNFGEKVLVNGVKVFSSVTYDILGKES